MPTSDGTFTPESLEEWEAKFMSEAKTLGVFAGMLRNNKTEKIVLPNYKGLANSHDKLKRFVIAAGKFIMQDLVATPAPPRKRKKPAR